MRTSRLENLPDALTVVKTRPLFVMRLKVRPLQIIGAGTRPVRRVGIVFGGVFEGERLSGEVLDGGSDWQTVPSDSAVTLDVRLILKTEDGALIGMTYRGIRHGPPEILARVDRGEAVDPASYYFRTTPFFETAAPNYDWLNRVVAVGIGHRTAEGPIYSLFELL
jgi:Protein of unknown function (DUF3237)